MPFNLPSDLLLNFITIENPDDIRIAAYQRIREKDLRGRHDQFIAEGKVVLNVLLRSTRFQADSLLIAENRLAGLLPLLQQTKPQCPIYCVKPTVMDAIAGFHIHRGILAMGKRREPSSLETFLHKLPQKALVPVVCGISNHDNMGAIFRNSAAFATQGIILDQESCDPLYRKAIRVSVGAALQVPYARGTNIDTILLHLKNAHFTIFALTPTAANILNTVDVPSRTALIFGTEGKGLPKHILQKTHNLRIPIARDFDSLNVATATGIALSHFYDRAAC